ncbi:hypothetical protein VIGAN_02196100 [Vigna angularis var. angularis]|uniref:Uncharacterized protein n=1 Tax=Vigna angularis var. angularis TaxID=157739 RepID=A0A0S3REU2_PHAAN|nr:hypothetical protein VIGAN_02196100 [Vigna angularis var. angularis]
MKEIRAPDLGARYNKSHRRRCRRRRLGSLIGQKGAPNTGDHNVGSRSMRGATTVAGACSSRAHLRRDPLAADATDRCDPLAVAATEESPEPPESVFKVGDDSFGLYLSRSEF